MPADQPFEANIGGTISGLAVSTSGGSSQITLSASTLGFAPTIMVTNASANVLFFRLDRTNTVTVATSTDIPIPGNTSRCFANPVPVGPTYISISATITVAAGPGVLYFTPGQGGIE